MMTLYNKIDAYIKLLRYKNSLMAGLAALIAVIITYSSLYGGLGGIFGFIYTTPQRLGYVVLMVFLATGGGNALNDFYDMDIDKINRPERPIPSGKIKPKNAYIFSYFCFVTALSIGFAINIFSGIIGLFNVVVMILYAQKLKTTTLLGNLSVAYLVGSIFLFGGSFFGLEGIKIMLPLFFLSFFATASREIVKDIEDIKGDAAKGAKTFPIVYGKKKSEYLAAMFIIPAAVCTPLPYIFGYFGKYYIIAVIPAGLGMIYALYRLLIQKDYAACSKILKISMLIALISFVAGLF